jgi:hypothetical protein
MFKKHAPYSLCIYWSTPSRNFLLREKGSEPTLREWTLFIPFFGYKKSYDCVDQPPHAHRHINYTHFPYSFISSIAYYILGSPKEGYLSRVGKVKPTLLTFPPISLPPSGLQVDPGGPSGDRNNDTSGSKFIKRGALSILAAQSNALYLSIWFHSFANEIISIET